MALSETRLVHPQKPKNRYKTPLATVIPQSEIKLNIQPCSKADL